MSQNDVLIQIQRLDLVLQELISLNEYNLFAPKRRSPTRAARSRQERTHAARHADRESGPRQFQNKTAGLDVGLFTRAGNRRREGREMTYEINIRFPSGNRMRAEGSTKAEAEHEAAQLCGQFWTEFVDSALIIDDNGTEKVWKELSPQEQKLDEERVLRTVRDGDWLCGHFSNSPNPDDAPSIHIRTGEGPGDGEFVCSIDCFDWCDVRVQGSKTTLSFEGKKDIIIEGAAVQYVSHQQDVMNAGYARTARAAPAIK